MIKIFDLFAGIGGFRLATEKIFDKKKIKSETIGWSEIDKYCQTALGNIKIAIVRPHLCFATASILLLISSNSASQ